MADIDQFADPDGRSVKAVASAWAVPLPAAFSDASEVDGASAADDPALDELAELLEGEPEHLAPRPPQSVEPSAREVRQALRDALVDLDTTAARLASAKTALHKGAALLGEVDASIAARRNAERATAEAAGDVIAQRLAECPDDAFTLPAGAPVDLAGPFEAARHREAIVAAHDRLVANLQQAEGEHASAVHRLAAAVASVARSEAHTIADRLQHIEAEAETLRARLHFAPPVLRLPVRYGAQSAPLSYSPLAAELVHAVPRNAAISDSGPMRDAAVARWGDFAERLIRNPEFRIGDDI